MKWHLSVEEAKQALQTERDWVFTTLLQHGTLSVEYYAPVNVDAQQPHPQSEVYVIASGRAVFNRNGEEVACKQGDVLFVPAGMKHRFENFSDDFATWVIFYGGEGGETDNTNFK